MPVITPWGRIRRRLLGLRAEEISFAHRGFRGATSAMRTRLEEVGGTFLAGYHAGLEQDTPAEVAAQLETVSLELRGFAFEGAAMALAWRDTLTFGRANRVRDFLAGAGDAHAYMVHVGVGWVWARLPLRGRTMEARLDPLLRWLAFDGWGFHEGFFHGQEYLAGRPAPERLAGYERRVFDLGLGRSLWFVNGGNAEWIARSIADLPVARQPDLWSGIGLAATYAGLVSEDDLLKLREHCHPHSAPLAQGSAFAAKARQRAGNLTAYTHLATGVLCGMSALEAARLCDTTLENLPANASEPAFELWRHRIQNHFRHPQPQLQES